MRQNAQMQLLCLGGLLVLAVLLFEQGPLIWQNSRLSKVVYVYNSCSGEQAGDTRFLGRRSAAITDRQNATISRQRAEWKEGQSPKPLVTRQTPEERNFSLYAKRRGYVVILYFMVVAQQAVGLKSFVSPQCWLGSFNLPMYIVQPFIQNSIVHTVPSNSSGVLTMSNFIDISHYNAESRRQGWGEVVSWEDFQEEGPRNVIYVQTKGIRNCRCMYEEEKEEEGETPMVLWEAKHPLDCLHLNHPGPLLYLAGKGKQFCVVRLVAVHPNPHICTATEMHRTIFGEWKPEDVTLVFQRWCPGMYIPNPALADPGVCRRACNEGLKNKFLPSHQLLGHARKYEALHSEDGRHYKVAVMLRSEHVLVSLERTQWNRALYICLTRTSNLMTHLQSKAETRQSFLTVDIGSYGSNSWKSILESHKDRLILQRIKGTLVRWLNHSVTYRNWENGFTNVSGGIQDRGYIAALQRTIASRADCLVLLGGGNFLRLALDDYLSHHPEPSSWCLHFVCLDDRFRNEYRDVLLSQDRLMGHTSWRRVNKDIPLYVGSLNTKHAAK